MYDRDAVHAEVRVQARLFDAAVLGLLAEHEGRYCVWYNAPLWFGDDLDKALEWAYKHVGADNGFVIARVEAQRIYDVWPRWNIG